MGRYLVLHGKRRAVQGKAGSRLSLQPSPLNYFVHMHNIHGSVPSQATDPFEIPAAHGSAAGHQAGPGEFHSLRGDP